MEKTNCQTKPVLKGYKKAKRKRKQTTKARQEENKQTKLDRKKTISKT